MSSARRDGGTADPFPAIPPPYLWGAYGEYLYLAPHARIHKISEDVPAESAVLICAVLGNAVRWLRQVGNVSLGNTVVIEGPGQQGLAAVVVAKESGASNVIVTGVTKDLRRFEMAKLLGADHCIDVSREDPVKKVQEITNGEMADLVMDVTGHKEGAIAAIDMVKKGGTVVLPGLYGTAKEVPLLLDKVVTNEIRLQGVYSHNLTSVGPAVKIAESRKYPLEKMVTHRYPPGGSREGHQDGRRRSRGGGPDQGSACALRVGATLTRFA